MKISSFELNYHARHEFFYFKKFKEKISQHLNEPVHCDHGELKRKLVVKDGLIV